MDERGQGSSWQELTLPGAVTKAVEGGYQLWLSAPPNAGMAPLPVLWLLDGASLFASVARAVSILSRRADATGVGPMVVVGVDHDPPDKGRRDADYSFGPCRDPARLSRPAAFGGGEAMLDRILSLFPQTIQSRVRCDGDRQALLGHSLGGFFALNALALRPGRIRVAGAISPSIWWDASAMQTALSAMPDAGQSLFLAAGSREEPAEIRQPADERRIARGIVREARTAATIVEERLGKGRVKLAIAEDEDHASAFLTVLPAFLRFASASLSR
jgi:predicted alpha/beta superfamily hydrolase